MKKSELFENYGHAPMRFMEQDGLYYFESTDEFITLFIACDTIPNLATPETELPLIEFKDHIVGAFEPYDDEPLSIYDIHYTIVLEQKRNHLC